MRPRNTIGSFLAVAVLAAFVVLPAAAAEDAKKANVNGTWTWSFTTQNGEKRESTAKLKQDGEKVTGTVSGRQGGETEIKDGKLDAEGKLTFTVTREFNGNTMVAKYEGKVEGDTIKGKSSTKRGDGEAREREWEAKRAKEGDKKDDAGKKEDAEKKSDAAAR